MRENNSMAERRRGVETQRSSSSPLRLCASAFPAFFSNGARRRAGITLLEVLVAAVLLSAAAALISQSITGSMATAYRADRTARAAGIASDVFARLDAGELSVVDANEGEEDPDFYWTLDSETGDQTDLRIVTVVVQWPEGAGIGSFEAVRYVYDRTVEEEETE